MEYPSNWRIRGQIHIPPAHTLEFIPHEKAPLFQGDDDDFKIINEAARKASGKLTDALLEVYRQAGYVSLWFFLRHILSYSGPYNLLTDHLHVDLANFRQRMLEPGSRAAVFISRSMFKTTICTHGADTWEILRDPNIRIGIIGATKDDAARFMNVIQDNFESNELLRDLYPEYAPKMNADRTITQSDWTKYQFVTPARTRNFPEPTVKCLGAGGATAGNHFDLLNVDDLVGEQQLNADHVATADMLKQKNWFKNNADTLLIDPTRSRVFLSATRYAVDDAYDWIMFDIGEAIGYFEELPDECQQKEDGRWTVYYRQAIERDLPIFPEKVPPTFLRRLRDQNPWGYFTQYLNNPYSAQITEFSQYNPGHFDMNYDSRTGWTIYVGQGINREVLNLSELTKTRNLVVTMGVDPGASEKKKRETTSRCAIYVQARDWLDRRFIIDVQAGYWEPAYFIKRMFDTFDRFYPMVSRTNLENMGAFNIFYNNVLKAQQERERYIGLYPIKATGDKDVKIRNFYQPLLEKDLIFVNNAVREIFYDELRVFPGGTKKDVLDAGVIADEGTGTPHSPEGSHANKDFLERKKRFASSITGA